MANVRKITHPSGEIAWRATVKTAEGKRKSKNHSTKKAADAWVRTNEGVRDVGMADRSVEDLARDHNAWFDGIVKAGERSQRTLDGYESHLAVHVRPDPIAKVGLLVLSTADVQAFLDRIVAVDEETGEVGSAETARRVRRSLSAWFEHGQRKKWLTHNPADAAIVVQKKRRRRAGAKLALPPKDDLRALLAAAAQGENAERDTAVVHVLMFGGFRISEMLGMADDAMQLRRPKPDGSGGGGRASVVERLCSRHTTLGDTKTEDSEREVPVGPSTAAAVRAWRVARGPVQAQMVNGVRVTGRLFPGPSGGRHGPFWSYSEFKRQCWNPLMLRAGLADVVEKRIPTARGERDIKRETFAFTPHTLRHVFASIQIENGVTPKRLQGLMGHATLAMTMDLYGDLWEDAEGDVAIAEATERLITR